MRQTVSKYLWKKSQEPPNTQFSGSHFVNVSANCKAEQQQQKKNVENDNVS